MAPVSVSPDFAGLLNAFAPQGWQPDATQIYQPALAVPSAALLQNLVAGSLPQSAAPATSQPQSPVPAASLPEVKDTSVSVGSPATVGAADNKPEGQSATVIPAPAPAQTDSFIKIDDIDPERTSLLQEFGCAQAVRRVYRRGHRVIIGEVFTFRNSDAAYAAYNLLRRGATTIITRGDASSEEEQSISFWQDKYFVRVFSSEEDDSESKDVVRLLADALSRSIASHGSLPQVISKLPSIERVRGSEKLVMGPLSARRFFPAPNISTLSFANARAAAVADYQMQAPYPERLKLLYVEYADANSASRAFYQYMSEFQGDQAANDTQPQAGTDELFKVGNSYLLCKLAGPRLIAVSGAKKRASARMFARMLY